MVKQDPYRCFLRVSIFKYRYGDKRIDTETDASMRNASIFLSPYRCAVSINTQVLTHSASVISRHHLACRRDRPSFRCLQVYHGRRFCRYLVLGLLYPGLGPGARGTRCLDELIAWSTSTKCDMCVCVCAASINLVSWLAPPRCPHWSWTGSTSPTTPS